MPCCYKGGYSDSLCIRDFGHMGVHFRWKSCIFLGCEFGTGISLSLFPSSLVQITDEEPCCEKQRKL